LTATAISLTTLPMPGPKPQDLEDILGRYPRGTKERIARLLGEGAPKGAQAELLREALERELRRRERHAKLKALAKPRTHPAG